MLINLWQWLSSRAIAEARESQWFVFGVPIRWARREADAKGKSNSSAVSPRISKTKTFLSMLGKHVIRSFYVGCVRATAEWTVSNGAPRAAPRRYRDNELIIDS